MKCVIEYYVKNKKLKADEIKQLRNEIDHPIVTNTFISCMFSDVKDYKNKFCMDENKIYAYRIIFHIPSPLKQNKDRLGLIAEAFDKLNVSWLNAEFKVKVKAYYPTINWLKDPVKIGKPKQLKVIITNDDL